MIDFLKFVKKHLSVGVIPIITVRNAFQVFGVLPYARMGKGLSAYLTKCEHPTPDVFTTQFDPEREMQNVKEKTAASTRLFIVRHVAFLVAVQLWKAEVVVVNLEFFKKSPGGQVLHFYPAT